MKIYLSLIITTILLSFSTAYFALNLQKNAPMASADETAQIKKLQIEFYGKAKAVTEIDLNSKFPSLDYFQLIQPVITAFNRSTPLANDCDVRPTGRMSKNYTDKKDNWNAFRCREITSLPDSFFEVAPFIHESGGSYAYLAYSLGIAPFNTSVWVKKHVQFFHISELKLLPIESLDENLQILSNLDESIYDALIKGRSPLLTADYYLVRAPLDKSHLYRVYARLDFEKFLSDQSLFIKVLTANDQCFYTESNICFKKNANDILRMLRPSSMIIFGSSILILILVCLILYSRIRFQNLEEERKKHALRVLTHELRTPISNLLLQVENINKQSDLIAAPVLEDLLKIEGEVYRLKRLAEKSSSYLNSQNEKQLIALDMALIPSINEFLADIALDYKDQDLKFISASADQSVSLDIYWFRMCLKNLIENAISYGVKPVTMKALIEKNILTISVTDNGNIKYTNLDAILNADKKIIQGSGLGMGLSLVKKIMHEMHGGLSFTAKPTTFSIWIRIKS